MVETREDWQIALSEIVTSIDELCECLDLDKHQLGDVYQATRQFSLRVPRQFINRMQKRNLNDPLLLQVLAQENEMQMIEGFSLDPLCELTVNPIPGLLHKYHGRVLVILTGACAINCRYCFRRHFPYADNQMNAKNWQRILDYISKDSSIEEMIFSGGDPLLLKDKMLGNFIRDLENINHLKRLRIHTRLPVVIPQRITKLFLAQLQQSRLQTIIIIHSNHANEIDEAVTQAMKKCREANIQLFNQAVLLKGINDDANTQINLCKKLFSVGVIPYYLHTLDPVQGAAHFFVDKIKAINIIQNMQALLPGYLLPRLVSEKPGALSKQHCVI